MEVVTAILTGALVVLTGVYAWLTRTIALKSGASADAALAAAQASQTAAEAAQRSAVIAEAALPLHFSGEVDRHIDGAVWFTIEAHGASVWIQSARIIGGTISESESVHGRRVHPVELEVPQVAREPSFPVLLQQHMNGTSLNWPNPSLRVSDWGCAIHLELTYSLSRDGDRRETTFFVEKPDDFFDLANRRMGLMVDKLSEDPADEDAGNTP